MCGNLVTSFSSTTHTSFSWRTLPYIPGVSTPNRIMVFKTSNQASAIKSLLILKTVRSLGNLATTSFFESGKINGLANGRIDGSLCTYSFTSAKGLFIKLYTKTPLINTSNASLASSLSNKVSLFPKPCQDSSLPPVPFTASTPCANSLTSASPLPCLSTPQITKCRIAGLAKILRTSGFMPLFVYNWPQTAKFLTPNSAATTSLGVQQVATPTLDCKSPSNSRSLK